MKTIQDIFKKYNVPMEEIEEIGEMSDGYHTFNSLYNQRMMLSVALFNTYKDICWKSRKHEDGEKCFDGTWFIVGIETPDGPYTYHYKDEFWDLFTCKELERAPKWDGHTDDDVGRLLSLTEDEPEEGTMSAWAKKEIDIAIAKERSNTKEDPDEFEYGVEIYKSVYKAYRSLMKDGHSGFSFSLARNILHRLCLGLPITPIEDTPDIWERVSRDKRLGRDVYQCKRMSSLFKNVYPNGAVVYSDIENHYCVNTDNPNGSYHSGLVQRIIDEIFPITMPYFPPTEKMKVICEEWLVDPKNGDFDTLAIYRVIRSGETVNIDRYFKEGPDGWVEISSTELTERLAVLNRNKPN